MQRFINRYPAGWATANDVLFHLIESARDLPTRAGWEILDRTGDVKIRIEAYEEQAGHTRVDFLDGLPIEKRRVLGQWIDNMTLEFVDKIIDIIRSRNPPIEWDEEKEILWPDWLPKKRDVFYEWRAIYRIWIEMLEECAADDGQHPKWGRKPTLADLRDEVLEKKGKDYTERHLRSIKRAGREGYFRGNNAVYYTWYLERRRDQRYLDKKQLKWKLEEE